jgi:hypothetical protein
MSATAVAVTRQDTLRGHVDELRISIEQKYKACSQMRRISLLALDQALQEATQRNFTSSQARDFLEEAIGLVRTTARELYAYPEANEDEVGRLWEFQDFKKPYLEGRVTLGGFDISPKGLFAVAREILARPWLRLDELEWAIVSALIFREVTEFGERVKEGIEPAFARGLAYALAQGNIQKMIWKRLQIGAVLWAIRWGLVGAGMCGAWLYVESHRYENPSTVGIMACALLVLVWLFVGFPVGRRAVRENNRKITTLLLAMQSAYATLKPEAPLSPYQIRAALLATQERGAVWPSAALALLDRAAMRDPPVWTF